ncbi:MAG TPA: hypothetical protein ENJ30_00830 [Desulfobulbaceae bacterium]|nr:hypothetical protein [Desulfobulbaceae bacterium]
MSNWSSFFSWFCIISLIFIGTTFSSASAADKVVVIPLGLGGNTSPVVNPSDVVELAPTAWVKGTNSSDFIKQEPDGTESSTQYIVPAGKLLVITTVISERQDNGIAACSPGIYVVPKNNPVGSRLRQDFLLETAGINYNITNFSPGILIAANHSIELHNVFETDCLVYCKLFGYLVDDK